MRGFIIILTSIFLLAGCTKQEETHPRPEISMEADSAAYIEMLENEITQKVLEKERNTRSMMLTVIIMWWNEVNNSDQIVGIGIMIIMMIYGAKELYQAIKLIIMNRK